MASLLQRRLKYFVPDRHYGDGSCTLRGLCSVLDKNRRFNIVSFQF